MIPKIDSKNFDFDKWIAKLNKMDKSVKTGKKSWQDHSNALKENERWIVTWGQETEGQIRTQEDMIQANESARQSAIDYNTALEQQTLGAKAASIGLEALKGVLNSAIYAGIAMAVSAAANAIITEIKSVVNAYEDRINEPKRLSQKHYIEIRSYQK